MIHLLLALCLSGCGSDTAEQPISEPPAWQLVLDDLDRVPLSVWAPSSETVYVVGGPLGNQGMHTLALLFDGEVWRDLAPGGSETFWWTAGTSARDVWMVGSEGRIAHYDGTDFTPHDSGTATTLWGVIAFAPDDVWVVGGDATPAKNGPTDVVLHYDGQSWTPVPLPGSPLGVALFKVWGTSSENLYVVGESGTIWHKSGDTWTLESESMEIYASLLTVHGCSSEEIYVVGGLNVLRSTGNGSWSKLDIELTSAVNGVCCASPGSVVIAGGGGQKQRLTNGDWTNDYTIPPYDDLHAAWALDDQTWWTVGGDFISPPSANSPRRGVVARFGVGQISGMP